MKTFSDYIQDNQNINEKIIVPEIDAFFSKDITEMKEHYPGIIFDNTIKQIGQYNTRKKEMRMNLDKIPDKQTLYQILFHESIHMIQDKKTLMDINRILFNEKLSKKSIRDKLFFLGQFEIMAYASTVALRLIFNGDDLENLVEIMNGRFSIIKELLNSKRFKKYVYLYYKEFKKEKYLFNIYSNESYSIQVY